MSYTGFKVSRTSFLVDSRISDTVYVVCCDDTTTILQLGIEALEEHKRTFPVLEGELNPVLQYVSDARGRILSGSLKVMNVDYENGLEIILNDNTLNVPSSSSSGTNANSIVVNNNTILNAISAFNSDQEKLAQNVVSHLQMLKETTTSSSSGLQPLPEVMNLLSQISNSTSIAVQTYALQAYDILCNTVSYEYKRFMFNASLVGIGVRSIQEIFNTTTHAEIASRCMDIITKHVNEYILLHSVLDSDLVGLGLHSKTAQLLNQGNDTSAALRAQLNKQIIQQSSSKSPLQLDVESLQTDTERAMIRFHINTKLQGKLLKSCTDIVATLSDLGLYHTSSDLLLQNAIDTADKTMSGVVGPEFKNALGLGKSSNKVKGQGKLAQNVSAPLLSIKTMKQHMSDFGHNFEHNFAEGSEEEDDEDGDFDGESAISQSPPPSLTSSATSLAAEATTDVDGGDGHSDDDDDDDDDEDDDNENNNEDMEHDSDSKKVEEVGSLSVSSSEQSAGLSVLEEGDENSVDPDEEEEELVSKKTKKRSKKSKSKGVKQNSLSQTSLDSHYSSSTIDNRSTTSSIASQLKGSGRSSTNNGSRQGLGRGRTVRPSASEPALSSRRKVQPPPRKRLIQVEGGKLMEIIEEVGIVGGPVPGLGLGDDADTTVATNARTNSNMIVDVDDVDTEMNWLFPPASPRSLRLQTIARRHLSRTGVNSGTMGHFNLLSDNAPPSSSTPLNSIALQARKYLLSGEKSLVHHFLDSLLYTLSSTHYSIGVEMLSLKSQTDILPAIKGFNSLKKVPNNYNSSLLKLNLTNSDVFEVAVLVAGVLRNSLQPPSNNNDNNKKSSNRNSGKSRSFEGMAEALLFSSSSDLNRAFQCTLILQLLSSHFIPLDEDATLIEDDSDYDNSSTFVVNNSSNSKSIRFKCAIDAVMTAMHAPTPQEVYSKLADTYGTTIRSTTPTAPMRLVFTLAHWTDRSLIWNSNSTATAMGDLADSCLELFCISIYHNCRTSPTALVLHQNDTATNSNSKRDMTLDLINHLSTSMTTKFLKLSEKKVFGPHLYVSLIKILSILNQFGPASQEYAEVLASNDYAIASWLIHYTPLVLAKSIKDSSISWDSRALEWISVNGNNEIEVHKKILSINHWADEPVHQDQDQIIVGAGFPSVMINSNSNKKNPVSLNLNPGSNLLNRDESNSSITTIDSHNSPAPVSISSKAVSSKHRASNTSLSPPESTQLHNIIGHLIPYSDMGETPMILTTIAAAAVNKPCRDFLLKAGLVRKLVNIIGSLVHSCVIVYRAKDDGESKKKGGDIFSGDNTALFTKSEPNAEQQAKQASMASFLEKRRSIVPAFGAHKSASTSSIGSTTTGGLVPLSARAMAEQAAQAAKEAEKKRKEAEEEEKKRAKEREEAKEKAAKEAEKEALKREQAMNRAWIDPIAIRQNTPLIALALKALANLCYADPDTAQMTGNALIEALERRVRLKTIPTSVLNAHIDSTDDHGKENGGLNRIPSITSTSTLSEIEENDGDELLPKIKRNQSRQEDGSRLSVQEQIAKYNHIDHYHYTPEDNDDHHQNTSNRPVLYDESRIHAMHCVLRRMAGVDKSIVLYLTFLDCSNPLKMPTTDPQTAHNQLTSINSSGSGSVKRELEGPVASANIVSIKDIDRIKDTARSTLSVDTTLTTARSDAMSAKRSPRKLAKMRKAELAIKAALGFRSKINGGSRSRSPSSKQKARTDSSIVE